MPYVDSYWWEEEADIELNKCETELKKKNDEIKRHIDTIKALRQINEMKEIEKEDLKKKLKETEGELQEKSKLAGFSSKLKNELYIKNAEIITKLSRISSETVQEEQNWVKGQHRVTPGPQERNKEEQTVIERVQGEVRVRMPYHEANRKGLQ